MPVGKTADSVVLGMLILCPGLRIDLRFKVSGIAKLSFDTLETWLMDLISGFDLAGCGGNVVCGSFGVR